MADQPPPAPSNNAGQTTPRKRANTAASLTQSIASFTEDLVLHRDPAPGFFAATAQATSKAPTLAEIRRGSFGEEGWGREQHVSPGAGGRGSGSWSSSRDKRRSWSGKGSRDSVKAGGQAHVGTGGGELFAPLTEEPGRISEDVGARRREEVEDGEKERIHSDTNERAQHPGLGPEKQHPAGNTFQPAQPNAMSRAYSSGYIPPPKLPWAQSTAIALKAFWRWFITPFGFFVTLYGLNVVAWGGMLFLLLCNASPAMCHAPIPTAANRQKMPPAAALDLPGPYYVNCNDINSPRRIWIEIDSQILNALFCVTGFGLVPWRFRDLYYILRYRFASSRKQGVEGKMYGLRVLAGIHRGWFRLPGSETVDTISGREYLTQQSKTQAPPSSPSDLDLESAPSGTTLSHHDIRLPLPLAKGPSPPVTSIRARPTKIWLMDFFIWCQVWNTFFQCCLCGFMWGQDRYDRPPWSTGLFVALACIIAGVGGVVSFVEGRKVKRVEGVEPEMADVVEVVEGGDALTISRTGETERESVRYDDKGKEDGR